MSEIRRRKRAAWIAMVKVSIIMLILTVGSIVGFFFFIQWVLESQERRGFTDHEIVAPLFDSRPLTPEGPPEFIRTGPLVTSANFRPTWYYNRSADAVDAIEGLGVFLNLGVVNDGSSRIYVESISYEAMWGESETGYVGKYVGPGEHRYMRHMMIPFGSPPPAINERSFSITMDVLIEGVDLIDEGPVVWVKREGVSFSGDEVNLIPLAETRSEPDYYKNLAFYYDKVRSLVRGDMIELREMLERNGLYDETFTIQDIPDAFEFMNSRIDYESDPDTGANEWISPVTCLARGGGDCEDYSILFGAIITCLGGNARVIFSNHHAFNAVYIGEDDSILELINERFGASIPFQIMEDKFGKWLIIEPQSHLIFGWFPVNVIVQEGPLPNTYIYGNNVLGWVYEDSDEVSVVDIYI